MKLELESDIAYYCVTEEIADKFAEAYYNRYNFPIPQNQPWGRGRRCIIFEKGVFEKGIFIRPAECRMVSEDWALAKNKKIVDVEELLKTIDEPQDICTLLTEAGDTTCTISCTDTYKTIDIPYDEHIPWANTTKDGQLRTPTKPLETAEQDKPKNQPIMDQRKKLKIWQRL